ncbi:MAG: SpoVG family protein [Oscillospiraceae bacterium]|nr:SpoVG family protein [Oscillospiraceae bacterium]
MPKAAQPAPKQESQSPMQFDVRIYPVKTDGALKANASVNINGFIAVTNVRVLEGTKGTFVSLPQYKGRNGEYKDICFPCTREAKAAFDKAVLSAYEQTIVQSQTKAQAQKPPQPEQGQQMVGM